MHPVSEVLALRDVREGGEWTPSQRAKNDAIYALAVLALTAARPLPRRAAAALGRGLGRLLHGVLRRERAIALANLKLAYPRLSRSEREALARAAFVTLGGLLGETVAALHGGFEPLPFPEASRRLLSEALAEGRGVVLPSAHLGPWERLAATLVAHDVPLTTMVRASYDPRFDALTARLRGGSGVETIPRGAPAAPARILRALRRGRVLGAPMDLASRVPSAPVPFLGQPARTAVGPARIALRTGAPVVVCTVERTEAGALAVTATRLDRTGAGAEPEEALALTARINAELGRRIRTAPEMWPWMHRRFG